MSIRSIMFTGLLTGLLLAVLWVSIAYRRDLSAAKERVQANSQVIESSCGPIEYAEAGTGYPVLVIHGAGGGYDQGLLAGTALLGREYRVIVPSRFGYLNAGIPQDSSLDAQADTFACLLDAMEIDRISVIAISAGGPPGLHFALRHPERIDALVLVSAISYTENTAEDETKESVINRIVSSDFVYWSAIHAAPASLLKLFGVPKEVQAKLSPTDKEYTNQFLEVMLPISLRWEGILLDQSHRIGKDIPLAQIQVPTLVFHARDDTLVDFSNGEYSASQIPNSELVPFEDGGHFLLGHFAEIQESVTGFLAETIQ